MKQYSFKKGLGKGVLSLLSVLGALTAFANLADATLWDLLVNYLKPVLGSLTVGGVITIAINFVKFKLAVKE